MMTTAELIDDVCEMLSYSDRYLSQLELTHSSLQNQLDTLIAQHAEEEAFYLSNR